MLTQEELITMQRALHYVHKKLAQASLHPTTTKENGERLWKLADLIVLPMNSYRWDELQESLESLGN